VCYERINWKQKRQQQQQHPREEHSYIHSAHSRWEILERRLVTMISQQQQPQQQDKTAPLPPDPLRPYLIRNIIPVLDSLADQFRPLYLPVCTVTTCFFFSRQFLLFSKN
jgi:hypothetical protein